MTTVEKSLVINVEECGLRRSSGTGIDVYSDSGDRSDEDQRSSIGSETEIVGVSDKERESCVSECSVEVDLECGVAEDKLHLAKVERDCRICHLSIDAANPESGFPIELGCSCKDDLAAAHKQCAEAWFKIKGNK